MASKLSTGSRFIFGKKAKCSRYSRRKPLIAAKPPDGENYE
jgi:hypothetical protein